MSSTTKPSNYKPQLDGLRAFAVLAVWLDHWHLGSLGFMKWIPWGGVGVRLFFVLSGYLITAILIRAKNDMLAADQGLMLTARQFYIRRFLRIFPIYYLVLFVTALLAIGKVRQLFWWHLTYTTNFYFGFHPPLDDAGMHFWTLAVEEQFYLVWPWVILLVPSRHRIKAILLVILIAPIFRVGGAMLGWPAGVMRDFPIGCMDSLGIGALLAAIGEIDSRGNVQDTLCRWALWIGLPSFAVLMFIRQTWGDDATWVYLAATPMSLIFAWIINGASKGFGGPVKYILEFPVITYLGKISYGLYVYHGLMRPAVWRFAPQFGEWMGKNDYRNFLILGGLSIIVSIISWHAIEKPINNLKKYFDYTPKHARGESRAIVAASQHASS